MKFLIIDDSPEDRKLFVGILQKKFPTSEFMQIIRQQDLDEAIARCDFDVVVTDYHLDWTNGLRLLKMLKDRFPYIPVVMATNTRSEEIAVEGMKSGLSDFVLKKHLYRLPDVVKESLEKIRLIKLHDELEELLREREEQLSGFFNGSSAGMAILDSQLRYLKINEPLADINGRPIEDHIGKTIHGILPKLAPFLEPFFQKILTTGEPIRDLDVSGETLKEPGITRHWTTSFFPIKGKDKKPMAIGAVVVEITGRKRTEETLRETMELFRQLVENIHEVFYVYSGNWKHACYISPSYEDVWGCTSRSLYEQPLSFMNCIHPDDREHVLAAMQTSENAGSKLQIEYRIIRPDKSIRWIYDRSFPVLDTAGQISRFVGIAEDITERKRAERHLNMQYAVTRLLSESATIEETFPKILQTVCETLEWDVGEIWIVDQKTNILRCGEIWHNPSFKLSEFKKVTAQTTFSHGIGLPGRVWASTRPLWIADVVPDTNFPRSAVAAREGLHGAFGFPILSEREVIGVIDFFNHEIQQPDTAILDMMAATGSQIGQFIERKQAEGDLRYRLEFEKTVAGISNRFVRISDFNDAISASLVDIGRLRGASRAYLFQFRDNGNIMDNTHEWCNDGVTPEIQNLQNLPSTMCPWWMENLNAGKVIHIIDVSQLPPEANSEKEILEKQGIKSLLSLPVYAEKELAGFIGFDNVVATGTWHEEDISLLRITAEIFGNAIARKRSEALINHMAYHDALTNLPNRILFQDRLQMAVIQAKRNERMVAVMILDLDCFKTINDTLGHHIGDLLLKAVAERLTQGVREGDTIARMGGDEFMVVLPDLAHTHDTVVVAQKFLGALCQPFQLDNHKVHITASIGISLYPSDADDTSNLIRQADIAMYRSKECGKNTYRFYKDDINTHAKISKNPASGKI